MGKVIEVIAGAALAIVGVFTGNPYLIAAGIALTAASVLSKPKAAATNSTTGQRLTKNLDVEANRKIVFGKTAAPQDVRYWEDYGTDNNSYVEVIACATHRLHGFGETYFNTDLAFTEDGTATTLYSGSVTRTTVLEGASGSGTPLGAAGRWTSSSSMTGMGYMVLTWQYSQDKLPQGIPSRYTQIVYGAPIYDPRRDISLGGTHDVTDNTTWEYSPTDSNGEPIGRNNALQMLWYELGWYIDGKLVAGRGVSPNDVDFDSFIQAANDCEAARWYSDCALSTGDTHGTNEGIIAAAAGGVLLDTGGRFSYAVAVDDTANVAVTLTDDDVLGGVVWTPRQPMSNQYNEVAGTFVDPTQLYQALPYAVATDATYVAAMGYTKRTTLDLQAVQDPNQAWRLAHLLLNRGQVQGEFQATFNYRAFKARNWNIVKLTFSRYGWTNKLFRITEQQLSPDGGIIMTLLEENPIVYTEGTVPAAPSPGTATGDDPRAQISVSGFAAIDISKTSGDSLMTQDGLRAYWVRPSQRVARTELRYRKTGETSWTQVPAVTVGASPLDGTHDAVDIWPLQTGTEYDVAARHVTIFDVPGNWSQVSQTTGTTTSFDPSLTGIADGTVQDQLDALKAGLDAQAELSMSLQAFRAEVTKYFEGLTYIGGIPVGTVVVNNQTAQSTVNTATASNLTFLGSAVSTNSAAILTEQTTRAAADTAEATARTTLAATVASNTAAITSEATTRATADSATATTLSGLSSTVGANTSAIVTEQSTRASADTSLASSITSVSSTVGGLTSSVSSLFTAQAGEAARATLTVSGSGYISGWTASAGASGGDMKFTANNFYFVDPGTGAAVVAAAYSGGTWYFSSSIEVQAIKANTIVATHIISNEIANVTRTYTNSGASVTGSPVYIGSHSVSLSGGPVDLEVWTNIENSAGGSIGVNYYMVASGYTSDTWGHYVFDGPNGNYNSTTFVDRWTPPSAGSYTFSVYATRPSGGSTLVCNACKIKCTDNKVQS